MKSIHRTNITQLSYDPQNESDAIFTSSMYHKVHSRRSRSHQTTTNSHNPSKFNPYDTDYTTNRQKRTHRHKPNSKSR